MPFKEEVKEEVKKKAAFRCCRCQSIGVEVHHIMPEADAGPSTIDNAAPLCPSCHDYFGDNPRKRKEIRQMRDWWYEKVESMYPDAYASPDELRQINSKLEALRHQQSSDLSDLKTMLKGVSDKMIEGVTLGNADATASAIINTSAAISAVTLGDKLHANVRCNNCGTAVGLLIGSNRCPNCGTQIR